MQARSAAQAASFQPGLTGQLAEGVVHGGGGSRAPRVETKKLGVVGCPQRFSRSPA
jgi:hypothetical protein